MIERYVVVGRVDPRGARVDDQAALRPISDDVWVVAPEHPARRLMKRIYPAVSAHGGWRKALANASPFLAQPPRGIPPLVETGVDAEGRLCLVLEEQRLLPRFITAPRNFPEAARLALDVLAVLEPTIEVLGSARGHVSILDVGVSIDGDVIVDNAGLPALPPELGGSNEGAPSLATSAAHLVAGWGHPLPRYVYEPRAAYDYLQRAAAPDLPWRARAPGVGEARRYLDALSDSDVDEMARVQAALALSRVRGLDEEVVRLLVRCLNEPLAWLPHIALEILSDWPVPFGIRVDDAGLVRRCPHPWATTEVIAELGGVSIERHCADCDARVVLPQSIATLASKCEVARAFVDDPDDQRDAIAIIEPGWMRPLLRGRALRLGRAVDLVNIGRGRVCLRRRTLAGDHEIEAFLPGARVRYDNFVYRRSGEGIVVERALD